MAYQKIVVALELIEEGCDEVLLTKAKKYMAEGAKVHFLHAVEHMSNYGAAYGIVAGVDIERTLCEEAKKSMAQLVDKLGVNGVEQVVRVGPAKFVILEEAKKMGADLIMVGSHGRHGVRLLLGSTANAVLHGAHCDVLAVRVGS